MQIRLMALEDVEPVMAIAEALEQAPRWSRDAYMRALDPAASPARIALVAEDSQMEIVGFVVTSLIPPQAELESIGVAARAQRRGVARGLFEELLAELKKRQITEVILEVRESNLSAQGLYRFLGFAEVARRRDYYLHPQEDALVLHRSVAWAGGAYGFSGVAEIE